MKLAFVSLGCDKNLVDSEEMLELLSRGGRYVLTDDEEEAEAAVVNTCCFIDDAKKESIGEILSFAERRKSGQLKALIITGCMAQRYSEDVLREIPEVDAVVGTTARKRLPEALDAVIKDGVHGAVYLEDKNAPEETADRLLSTGGHYAYLKIAEGCSKHCTYCAIPGIRGEYRSVPMPQLLAQARDLAAQGVKELILVAQETTVYGRDLYGEKKLPELIRELCKIEELKWIRILYCYPEEITDELIGVIRDEPKVVHYIDMPIQHASDDVLKRMGRRTNRKELEETVRRLRENIPDICIRTTLLTGFPGELEKDHEILCRFVKKMKFDRLGAFMYSKEEGTPAAKMKPQVPAPVKRKRHKELMLLQQEIAFRKARAMKDKVLTAFIEGKIAGEDVYTSRTYMDTPGVDGTLFIESDEEFMSGDFVQVKITGADGYDLIGVPVPEE